MTSGVVFFCASRQIVKKTINQVYSEFSAKEADELDQSEVQLLRAKYDEANPCASPAFSRLGIPAVLSISNYHPSASLEDVLSGKAAESSNREELFSKTWTDEELLEEARTLELLYGEGTFRESTLAPAFVQFCPPLMEVTDEELGWMDLDLRLMSADHDEALLWDGPADPLRLDAHSDLQRVADSHTM